SHIFVTNNYGYFSANEWDASCELRYQRQHIYCLYRMEGDALSCTLLSAEEASAYLNGPAKEKWGSRDRDIHIWLESPSGNLVLSPAISKPAAIEENRHYWDIRTQIQFFRGDIDLLLENPHIEWVQNLHTRDRDAFLDRILDNPIFLKKKQFAIDNREKFLKHCDCASQVLV